MDSIKYDDVYMIYISIYILYVCYSDDISEPKKNIPWGYISCISTLFITAFATLICKLTYIYSTLRIYIIYS